VRRVIWTVEARANLAGIRAYISQFNPLAARRLATGIVTAADSLEDHAERGRRIRGTVRELSAIYPYLIRYQIEDDRVLILRVRHGARRPE